ncbi:MAG: prepilin peptidase [Deferrisomatales bacterium]|nr:prepilin peptidase [Deferrisomatales bacterium]
MTDPIILWGGGVAATFGAVVGSFLNVVIHRMPRGESLSFPPSHCPRCAAGIRPWDNVPIISYLILRGRCRACSQPISPRYPLVEAAMAGLAAGTWLQFGPSIAFGVYFVFLAGLLAITFIDLDHKIIPDSLSLGGTVLGVAASFFTGVGWKASMAGALLGGGLLLAVALGYYALTRREGMGLGDAKLLAAIGAFLGWQAVLFTVFVSSVVGSVVGISVAVWQRSDLRFEVPYGPFLALGGVLYLFWGQPLITWYLSVLG